MRPARPARPLRLSRLPRPLRLLAALALLAAGCASSSYLARDLTITNQPDSFEMHVGSLENFTQRMSYQWTNSGTKATVRHASSIKEGTARLEIRDSGGRVVHSQDLGQQGTFVTDEGRPGIWRIRVTLERADGSVTFLVQKSG